MANQRAAAELASLLWTLAHEMSVEDFGAVESEVFTLVFALVHAPDKESRMAGLAALDGLLVAPSADEEKKAIKFANALSTGLRAANGDYEFFSAVSKALGHMAMRISNVDFVEAEVTRALEWLRTGRSDRSLLRLRRLAASLSLKEFAIHAPTTFHSKTSQSTLGQGGSNEFLDTIFQSIRDPQPIVRVCAADALSQCLRILVDRRHLSLTGLLCQIHFSTMEGLQEATKKQSWHAASESEAAKHGSLLVVGTMLAYTREFLLPRFEEICRAVLACSKNPKVLIRLEVVRLIPKLAACCSSVFGRRYLEQSLVFLIDNVSSPASLRDNVDIRPSVYDAIGDLIMAMSDENTGRRLEEIFAVVRKGLHAPTSRSSVGHTLCPALHCASSLVEALKDLALPYLDGVIDDMFQSGLSIDLIQCLHSIAQSIPMYKDEIEDRMLQEVSLSLAGNRRSSDHTLGSSYPAGAASTTESSNVHINMNNDAKTTKLLVLSLQTFASFSNSTAQVTLSGKIIPLMPFVQDVTARYLLHPSNEVRRAAALACCVLLIPHGSIFASAGSCSGLIIEDVLEALLRAAVSDSSAVVRLCVVRALDTRYDPFLCQTHHLQDLFLVLQDETLATRVAGLQLLGRLASLNPAPILPVLRRFLNDLVVELQCGVDTGRGREEATRLLVVFLRVKPLQRLIHPVLATLVGALPLTGAAPPRLASASLEALGELAQATGTALQPWVNDIIPHVLNTMKDQSSASKQRTSLRTLGQIAGSTGYVVRLYLDYPNLLSQATDILPATKRAPWTLRREVIRTLGIIGALDPDRYYSVASKARKGGVQYAMVAQPVSNLSPAKRMTPSEEDFYPTVSIQALMRIFRDSTLTVHHGMVIQAIMFIFKSLGVRCVPFLGKVLPHMILTIRHCPSNLKESLFIQLSNLTLVVKAHLRIFVDDIFDIVEQFWDSRHLSIILKLLSNIAIGVPDAFRQFVPRFIRRLLTSLDELQVADWSTAKQSLLPQNGRAESEKLSHILKSISKLNSMLREYLHILIPALLKLADSLASLSFNGATTTTISILDGFSVLNCRTLSALIESQAPAPNPVALALFTGLSCTPPINSENGLPSRVVQPLVRIFRETPPRSLAVGLSMVETLFDEHPVAPALRASFSVSNRQKVNQGNLQRAWDVSQRSSREDWDEWMRRFAIQLLREAPSPALRASANLAHAYQPLARELFSAAFACCWKELSHPYRTDLLSALETAFVADISPEILLALLNLAEFMEHDPSGGLPIDISILADLALKCRAYAKALHYKEREYRNGGSGSCVEALISINRKLDLQEGALGILKASAIDDEDASKQSGWWLAKLGNWTEALEVYREKLKSDPHDFEAIVGCMRCLDASGEWRKVLDLAEQNWTALSQHRCIVRMCAQAAWRLGQWDDLEKYSSQLTCVGFDGAFYSAVLHVHRQDWSHAADAIDAARKAMDSRFTALLAESYSRAYPSMVTAQMLSEMEEIIEYMKTEERSRIEIDHHPANRQSIERARERLISVWKDRLAGCRMDSEAHASILAVRSLVIGPEDDVDAVLTLSKLSRQAERHKFAERVLLDPLHSLKIQHTFYFAYVKHLWYTGEKHEATRRLEHLCDVVDMVSHCERINETSLRVACWLEYGEWKLSTTTSLGSSMSPQFQLDVLTSLKRATQPDDCGYKAWHGWSLLNFRIALQLNDRHHLSSQADAQRPGASFDKSIRNHVVAAVRGFVNAINLGTIKQSASVQQDLLNLLTCLFKFGSLQDVAVVLNECVSSVAIEAWLGVLPQLLARIHIKDPAIRSVLHPLLTRLGEKHPQALMYQLSVLLKSPVVERRTAAESLMNSLKSHSSDLVEESLMVSSELIRVAILWSETWHAGLENASAFFYVENNIAAMLDQLHSLHGEFEKEPETSMERDFAEAHGGNIRQAYDCIKKYIQLSSNDDENLSPEQKDSRREEAETFLHKAWDSYYVVFRPINQDLKSMSLLRLPECSPALSRARNLELGVPGSYRVDGSYVRIQKFVQRVSIINSKQRPRKVTLRGSDGKHYVFLLKGHEDLRQDERVMQLFGLVNALLVRDPQTKNQDLMIKRYTISPLSHNCGLVGWVPHCDTMHALIRDYREAKKVPMNIENREMMKTAPDYDLLTGMQKVEVFTDALQKTPGKGDDLAEIFWLKSTNSEEWLERRTKYTRSLAVMSMVGYILGLGDRHPSNLMIDKLSGRVLHIDFGDCFEIAMVRDKYPERVPFRLTRMLVKAMEVSGIEGTYRSTCERTMNLLRSSRDTLVAMLEAFVHDPLISWRLVNFITGGASARVATETSIARSRMERSLMGVMGGENGVVHEEALNVKALQVIRRVEDKLSGTDFPDCEGEPLDVSDQVQRLIVQATSSENLCQLFIGWCAFW
ncbi:predicted protein [Phaeodactylum tricornutum CCAP 1055/1]|uniref:Serine/threonine-protein kinase TOR n=3 Tax=Phaeodactylum tricornutum TaxID=2850 RepID=B7G3H7_PHATC|nr:predicted protein [Phaeodactylum tricornutum CCAP 1055/1]EEC46831.1 predicted protein [Phaeodactylum tricornutum CCAP 1055/1]|eukprot:XP_002181617.1 predicted protein [Phaeodactylum tricornutum CCAP 1055/1]